jgi:hypothetical protein
MRQLAGGVRKDTSRQLMLREFGCRPLVRIWVHSMVSMWIRVVASRDECLLKIAWKGFRLVAIAAGIPGFCLS